MRPLITLLALSFAIMFFGFPATGIAQNRVAFVTSTTGTGNLSTWEDAEKGLTGLAAGDSICVNLATTAGLSNPGNFVAWLSDDSDDAYCRVHNFTGKVSANCGQVKLPVAAGPWVRTDSVPFGASIENLLNPSYEVYTPLLLDENAAQVPIDSLVFTATNLDGTLAGETSCLNWITATGSVTKGNVDRTAASWTNFGTTACFNSRHLYCLETQTGLALELPESEGRIAFLTGNGGNGNLASWPQADADKVGIEAGDSICNNLAEDAGLPQVGSYKAWLSDATTDARDRFVNDGPWVRLDGFQIAAGVSDLTDSQIFTAINLTQNEIYSTNFAVWTGTDADGTAHTDHCGAWQSTKGIGRRGRVNAVSTGWTAQDTANCVQTNARLYCLSDLNLDIVFEHGFEQ